MRVDANISLRPYGQEKFGTKTELKNLNSFSNVRKGLEYEVQRQAEILRSGGQRQRVAMGRAIVRDAKVFLMDEPLSNLDAKLRVSMRAEIAKIHRRIGATTIYVTHDQTEAMTLADRIVIMSATKNPAGTGTIGRVEQIGTPQEVYKNPVNKFVAGFIGSPAMNFINVKLIGDHIVGDAFNLKVPEGALKVLRDKGYEGKELIFGIRPEDVNAEPAFLETFPESVVKATISVSELLGSESHLYCQVGKDEFVAKVHALDVFPSSCD